jgi:hypothetical protein
MCQDSVNSLGVEKSEVFLHTFLHNHIFKLLKVLHKQTY